MSQSNSVLYCMKTTFKTNQPKPSCPCCEQPTMKKFADVGAKGPPLAYLLSKALRLRKGPPEGRDWRIDPRPLDIIMFLDRAYHERPDHGNSIQSPNSRTVVRVSKTRVIYRRNEEKACRSCSLSTWRRLGADAVQYGRAASEKQAS